MRKVVSEKLLAEVADWAHRGLISGEQRDQITPRYQDDVTIGRVLLRWVGFFGVFLLGASILGFLGLTMGVAAQYAAPVVLAVAAYFMWTHGVRLATDPLQYYATSGAVLVTVGLITFAAALFAAFSLAETRIDHVTVAFLMLIVAGSAFFTAYRYALRWPLLLGVLLVFHALGNFQTYAGGGSYFFGIRDERITLAVAVASIVFGMWHERHLEESDDRRKIGFGQVYIVWGLVYANMSCWFLSLHETNTLTVVFFTATSILQIVLGGRFHDGRFVGFGIVFLSINLYTRMFEHFWDAVSKGAFFLIAGAIAVVVGVWMERRARALRSAA